MKSKANNSEITVRKEPAKRGPKPKSADEKIGYKVHLFFTFQDREILRELAKENNSTIGRFVKSILEPHIAKKRRSKK
jgi:hypothetical protein